MRKQLLAIWIIFVFVLLIIPLPTGNGAVVGNLFYLDKVVHFFMFGIFSFLIIYSYRYKYKNIGLFLISALLGAIYAALGEVVQVFLINRTSSMNDFFAGAVGSLFFVILYYVRIKKA